MFDLLLSLELSVVGRSSTSRGGGSPSLVAAHILGLVVSVGTIVWFDLRLLGLAMRPVPVRDVYRRLIPWAATGFGVMLVTGGLLFVGYATMVYDNTYFRLKMAAIALAGLNAFVYHRLTERHVGEWNAATRPPVGARTAGLISIVLWGSAIVAGRTMSYTMF